MRPLVLALGVAVACDAPAGPAIDAAPDPDAAIDAPDAAALDAPDAAALDALDAALDAPDAAAIDAPAIDAIDAIPIDGAPIVPLAPLALDPTFSDDGSFRFGSNGYPGSLTGSGPRLNLCAMATHWFDDITYWDNLVVYRATPGASEDLYGTVPVTGGGPITCPATALHPDGQQVSAFAFGATMRLIRRDATGALLPAQSPPQTGAIRALVPAPGGAVAVVHDDAVWLLDGALAPVTSFGTGGRVAVTGPVRQARRPSTAAPRLDLITDTAVRRLDLTTGAADATFGAGGVATLPAPITLRGVVPMDDGGELLVGIGTGYRVAADGTVTAVTFPPLDPRWVIADGAGGIYVITHPNSLAVELTITQVAPTSATTWEAGTSQSLTPPGLCPIDNLPGGCREWLIVRGAAWTDTGRLGVLLEIRYGYPTDFVRNQTPQLLVLTRP